MKLTIQRLGIREFTENVDVSDPCYSRDTWCRMNDVKIKAGRYLCGVWIGHDEGEIDGRHYPHKLIGAIGIYRNGKIPKPDEMEELGEIGVDAGMAGFFRNGKHEFKEDDEWSAFCDMMSDNDALLTADGFFSTSGYGDGSYGVYAYRQDSEITALEIRFLESEENEMARNNNNYESFKLRWMLDHGYTLRDLMMALQEPQFSDPEDSNRISTPVAELFDEWEADHGFNSEIWPCEEEWRECEGAAEQEDEEDEYLYRSMTEAEDKYSFHQSQQISSQCGLIGHLRADMDTDGNGFFSSWYDFREDLKTDEFKAEFDRVINSLREEGDLLHDRSMLAKVCHVTPQAKMSSESNYFGFRLDTDKYAYLLRVCPDKGEYNLYCYCYIKEWLDIHLKQASKGIRFIDSSYQVLFWIQDGGTIRVKNTAGETVKEWPCRYIDDSHVEVGDNLYHICEFAEVMERCSYTYEPVRKAE